MIFLIHKTFLICKSYYLMEIFYEKMNGILWKYSKREHNSRTRIFLAVFSTVTQPVGLALLFLSRGLGRQPLLPPSVQGNYLPGQVGGGIS